jgi:hypothetical protein
VGGGAWVSKAAYKSFFGEARVRAISGSELEVVLKVDPAGNRGPFAVGFTLVQLAELVVGLNGKELDVAEGTQWSATSEELGGGFVYGAVTVKMPAGAKVRWPFKPFNSYAADRQSKPASWQVRVEAELSVERVEVGFGLKV